MEYKTEKISYYSLLSVLVLHTLSTFLESSLYVIFGTKHLNKTFIKHVCLASSNVKYDGQNPQSSLWIR